MGSSMVGGLIKSGFVKPEHVIVSTKTEASLKRLSNEFNVITTLNIKDVVKKSDIIVLAVKPNIYKSIIKEIESELTEDKLIITIAAGITIENMEEWLGDDLKIIRTIPNTPALIGEAMTAICPNRNVSEDELEYCIKMFKSFGECEILEEKYFHGFIAVAGSSPAYVFMFIESMADAAVKLGIPRAKAYKMAAQSVLGSACQIIGFCNVCFA